MPYLLKRFFYICIWGIGMDLLLCIWESNVYITLHSDNYTNSLREEMEAEVDSCISWNWILVAEKYLITLYFTKLNSDIFRVSIRREEKNLVKARYDVTLHEIISSSIFNYVEQLINTYFWHGWTCSPWPYNINLIVKEDIQN